MTFSLTPLLVVVELSFAYIIIRRAQRMKAITAEARYLHGYLVWLCSYAIATSVFGAAGIYTSEAVLAFLPGLWLQVVTVGAALVPVILFPSIRNGLREVVDHTPWVWFAAFHALRISALGTAYKTYTGEFPVYFEMFVGVPDLAYGVSALWMIWALKREKISARGFMIWNIIGAIVIVPAAPLLLQMGLPGPLHVFTSVPDARAVYTFPMSIAPMFGVPFFVLVNLCVAWRLWERQRS